MRLALWQSALAELWVYVLSMGSVAVGCLIYLRYARQNPLKQALALAVLSLSLAFGQTSVRALWQSQQVLQPALDLSVQAIEGRVTSLPDRGESGWRFRFEPFNASDLPSAIWVNWQDSSTSGATDVKADQCWRLTLRLRRPYGEMNPHAFDVERWFWERGLGASGSVVRARGVDLAAQKIDCTSTQWGMLRYRQALRDTIEAQLGRTSSAGIIAALTLGDQASIERSDWDLFRQTGVAHLMAISGVHITALAWLVTKIVGWAWARARVGRYALALWAPAPWVGAVAGCVWAFIYAGFAGFELPAQRTVWMLVLFVALRMSSRQWPWHQVWCWVAWWVVMWDPFALMQAGFWLSFVAVAILFSSDSAPMSTHPIGGRLLAMVREQWLMSVCLAPLSWVLFSQVSIVGLIANLVAVPWVTFVVTPLAMLGVFFHDLWALAVWALGGLNLWLEWLNQWPGALWQISVAPTVWQILALLAMGVWALKLPLWIKGLALIWVLPMLTWKSPQVPAGEFELWALDVGQGQAIVIRTQHTVVLFDSGPAQGRSDAAQRVIMPFMQRMGWRPDAVILSHVDLDHSGGAASLLRAYPQVQWMGSLPSEHALAQREDFVPCEAGQYWQLDGVSFEVLHPQTQDIQANTPTNDTSCVLRLRSVSQRSALLTGDISAAQEKRLLARESDWPVDWLQVPHHGSSSSSSPAFVAATRPTWAVIQAGHLNRFGHPRAQVLIRYKEIGTEVVQTPHCGASLWFSGRPDVVQCERMIYKRFWHHVF